VGKLSGNAMYKKVVDMVLNVSGSKDVCMHG
jgi:hypothetical protein